MRPLVAPYVTQTDNAWRQVSFRLFRSVGHLLFDFGREPCGPGWLWQRPALPLSLAVMYENPPRRRNHLFTYLFRMFFSSFDLSFHHTLSFSPYFTSTFSYLPRLLFLLFSSFLLPSNFSSSLYPSFFNFAFFVSTFSHHSSTFLIWIISLNYFFHRTSSFLFPSHYFFLCLSLP